MQYQKYTRKYISAERLNLTYNIMDVYQYNLIHKLNKVSFCIGIANYRYISLGGKRQILWWAGVGGGWVKKKKKKDLKNDSSTAMHKL